MYTSKQSNRPNYIEKQIPLIFYQRLNNLSKSEGFNFVKDHYENALKHGGYTEKLTYIELFAVNSGGNRKRKLMYFQPPFSKGVKLPIEDCFSICSRSISAESTLCIKS